jgi:FkbM family methyltransferase
VGAVPIRSRVRERAPYALVDSDPLGDALSALGRGATFVQVGSNDGVTNDPIHRFVRWRRWAGVCVEPSPLPYARLARTYRLNRRVQTVNAAVAAEPGEAEFFYVPPVPGDPWYIDQIGSFSREHVVKHAEWVPGIESRVRVARVPVVTVGQVLDRIGQRVDLIHLDVEGYERTLLALLPYERIGAVLFEYHHLPADGLTEAEDRLRAHGFVRVAQNTNDVLWAHVPVMSV